MIEKSVLEQHYLSEHLSMLDVAKKLGVSEKGVQYWMDKHGIARRRWSEATYFKRNPSGDPFKIKTVLNEDDMFLLGLGLGLYWGEGTKANLQSIRLGNSDPTLTKAFIRFLREICGVTPEKITFCLQLFSDIDKTVAIEYWKQQLEWPTEIFHVTTFVSPPQGKGTYRNKCKYGVMTVAVNNKKLRNWLITQLINIRNADIAQW